MKSLFFVKKLFSVLKSRFSRLFLATFLSAILINYSLVSFSSPEPEVRGIWLTTNDTNILLDQPKLKEAIAQLSELNFNTIYPVVWNSGYALYPSKVTQQAGIQPFIHQGFQGQDPLADLIYNAHQKNLLVLGWFEFGFMTPQASELALKHPDWLTQKRDGSQTTISAAGEVVWLNPFHPQVQNFLTSLVMEVMDLYRIDGIQFDDHFSLPSELGYDPYTINLYQQETKKLPPENYHDPTWVKWRADRITAYVSQLRQKIRNKNPRAIFSISPNPYDTAYLSSLQDWLTWLRQDLIDELIVQVYRPDLNSFIQQLEKPEIVEAKSKIPTSVGVLTGLRNNLVDIDLIEDKVFVAQQNGLGVSFFYYGSLLNYSESLEERKQKILEFFPEQSLRKL